MQALGGDCPFIMIADGKASLFTPSGLKDAQLPAHYEPVESPVKNPLYHQQSSPVAKIWDRPDNRLHAPGDPRFPYALTTYRLTEHHAGGIPTRTVPVTAELQPEAFAEISPELAEIHEVKNLDLSQFRPSVKSRSRRSSQNASGHSASMAKPSMRSALSGTSAGRGLRAAILPMS